MGAEPRSPRKVRANLFQPFRRLRRIELRGPFERRVRFRHKGPDVHHELHFHCPAQLPHVLDDRRRFVVSIGYRKSDHEVQLRVLPAPGMRFPGNRNRPVQRHTLVDRPLRRVAGGLNCERQARPSSHRELLEDRQCHRIDAQRRELKADTTVPKPSVQLFQQIHKVGVVSAAERTQRDITVPLVLDEPGDLRQDLFHRLHAVRSVVHPGVAEAASLGAATHDFHRSMILHHRNRWHRKTGPERRWHGSLNGDPRGRHAVAKPVPDRARRAATARHPD